MRLFNTLFRFLIANSNSINKSYSNNRANFPRLKKAFAMAGTVPM
jgi:hypothetical protein